MDDKQIDTRLLLPDLYIENFRGIKKLSIPRLGRVTLVAGRNGVGKTTVLDAIRVYAARGRQQVLMQILSSREEVFEPKDQGIADAFEIDWTGIFHERAESEQLYVLIGPKKKSDQLRIESTLFDLESLARDRMPSNFSAVGMGNRLLTLMADFRGHSYSLVSGDLGNRVSSGEKLPPPLKFEYLGPGLLSQFDMARMWDEVALTADEDLITKSIELVFGEAIDRVVMVGEFSRSKLGAGRRAIVKLKSRAGPVPLRSLGEGAHRLFGIALALANSRDGFLLIDEAENGIHHSVQRDYWRMVLQTAHENNVQVFATTHSWDCVRGFALAAAELDCEDGVLVRLEKEDDGLRAVRYTSEDLKIAADQRIEVR